MTVHTAYIRSFAALTPQGIVSPGGTTPWDSDQYGAQDVRRQQVLDTPYPPFGKLNLPDRLAFSVVACMLRGIGEIENGERTAICLGVPYGSYATDLQYCASMSGGFPSPSIFSATLPSSPVAEIAIYYKIKGPDRVFAGGDSPGLAAIESAQSLFTFKKAGEAIVVLVHAPNNQEESGVAAAWAMYLTEKFPAPCIGKCVWELSRNPSGTGAEERIFTDLAHAFEQRRPVRLPVDTAGFGGYISFEREDR
jgi:hypothetical protein